jgi:hypothetical protein
MSTALSSLIVIVLMSLPALSQTTPAAPTEPAAPAPAPKKATAKKKALTNQEVQAAAKADEEAEAEADSAEGLTPYIEVERYDAAKPLKERVDDRISVFAKYNTNNFDAEERVTQATINFTTSSDLNIGLEYVKAFNDNVSGRVMAMLSHFYSPENDLVTPNIDQTEKDQGAYALGLRYLFTQDNYIDFALNYAPHYYFVQDTNTGNFLLQNNQTSSASIGMKNFFYDTTEASVGLDLGLEIISNAEQVTNDAAYYAGLIYRQNFKTGDHISVEFMYRSENSQSAQYILRNQAFSLSFMYTLPY